MKSNITTDIYTLESFFARIVTGTDFTIEA